MPNPVDLEPQAKAVADANANPPYLFELGPDQGRRTIDAVQSGPVKKPTIDIEDTTVPGGPSGQLSVRILRPQGAHRPLAVILYLHGVGWVFGNHHTHDRLIRELAVGAQAAVVFPNYSRSPEAKYPTAIQECYAVATWVAEHGQERGLDPSRIAIAGDSVGGNMSAAVTLLAKQRGGPAFRQ
ncbi:MAG TPA: alpha/beta hydrolase fold domain-containing protein, partial [Actinomycetota bacterium]|nr:alpha/beta hydrolase fold domain-containing protein [Actinomycetota bacterium]